MELKAESRKSEIAVGNADTKTHNLQLSTFN